MDAKIYQADRISYGSEWDAQAAVYTLAWRYYSGAVFNERVKASGGQLGALKYPLKINEAKYICVKHGLHLWGKADHAKIVLIRVLPKRTSTDAPKERAKTLESVLADFFEEEGREAMLRESGRHLMATGGVFFKLRHDPLTESGIAMDLTATDTVYPVFYPGQKDRLLRCHIKYSIPLDAAKQLYGYTGQAQKPSFGNPGTIEFLESWTEDEWACFVGTEGNWQPAMDLNTGMPLAGLNQCFDPRRGIKMLPIVYVPRLRTAGNYGESLIPDVAALQDEYNARLADQGDAVRLGTHPGGWGRNIKNIRGPIRISGPEILNIGDTIPGGGDPYIEQFKPPDISQGVTTFTDKLENVLFDVASISPVMRGVDEGSQRSGLTLAVRALPTTSLIDDYRASMRAGLQQVCRIFMGLCWGHRVPGKDGLGGITATHFGHKIDIEFAPILPRDGTEMADTVTKYRGAKVMSRKRAITMQPDVVDVDAEIKEIEAEEAAEAEKELAATTEKARATAEFRPKPAAPRQPSGVEK